MGIDYISIIESNMKIHLSMKYGLLLLAILSTMVYSQTADDDEVDTSVPGYPHKFYSGITIIIKDIYHLASLKTQKPFIMSFSHLKMIKQPIL